MSPAGALGDIGSALFAAIGVLAALRHRDTTGEGQYVDIAMYDAMVAMTDLVMNFWSMGLEGRRQAPLIMDGFHASDGWFIIQVGREHQFERLAHTIGHPEWLDRRALRDTREGWRKHMEDVIRPAIEEWAATGPASRRATCSPTTASPPGRATAPRTSSPTRMIAARNMLVEIPRTDGVEQPVIVPGNPVKLSKVARGPGDSYPPRIGEHTEAVLRNELGLDDARARRAARGRRHQLVNNSPPRRVIEWPATGNAAPTAGRGMEADSRDAECSRPCWRRLS